MNRDIIVVGASAGGVNVLIQLVHSLPAELPAALFVTLHLPASSDSHLPRILNRAGSLSAVHPEDGDIIQPGHIYISPPDCHLLIDGTTIRLSRGPKENGHRPAIDPMFRTAAYSHKQRVIGVILSGLLDDGTAGLAVVKRQGGIAIVQDPQEALFDSMPKSAIAQVEVDYVLPTVEIASTLIEQAGESINVAEIADLQPEADPVNQDIAAFEQGETPGNMTSTITCPTCGGVMWEIDKGNGMRFRCHVGHAYSADSLMSEQAATVESALWSAVRILEEQAALSKRLANRARENQQMRSERQFLERSHDSEKQAAIIRDIILSGGVHNRLDGLVGSIDLRENEIEEYS